MQNIENVECCELYGSRIDKSIGEGTQAIVYSIIGYPQYALKVITIIKKHDMGVWGLMKHGGGGLTSENFDILVKRMKLFDGEIPDNF